MTEPELHCFAQASTADELVDAAEHDLMCNEQLVQEQLAWQLAQDTEQLFQPIPTGD